ncbi:glycosyltransferase [Herbinix luporum]|jgi:glycosyltransferase involved in cell wall biosynthesis|uniref:Glycosyl transferase family 1 domain-containing protein n=1 Tax=Herbinix luporum TaxID=1679721 RepID=A0A0K8J4M9_9FIRM|nr:glycosyltransferase [Herbinix luporum]MDI9487923.1 glycosyltransferase [Bacillota bacterium]CUH92268.1 hypothetical protein SD1D_0720 [Herbinix luporum]HHT57682.1 glycosyltransferase family 4 protein [Herbinix luporum]
MKIMIIADSWPSLNIELRDLIYRLNRDGKEVICVLPYKKSLTADQIKETGLNFYFINNSNKIKSYLNYIMAYKVIKPDKVILLLNKHTITAGIAALICRVEHMSVIISSLNPLKPTKHIIQKIRNLYYKFIYKKILCQSDIMFFIYKDDYNLLAKWKVACKKRAVVLRSRGVDMNYIKKLPYPKTDLVFMSMPLLCNYGVKCYIEAAKLVRKIHPKVKFLLAGKFVENKKILSEQELDEACESGIIYYIEETNDIRPYLEVCSIFVQPNINQKEGHILEAHAAGRPILASNHPVNRSIMIDGYNGFILPVKEAEKWAAKILLLLDKQKLKTNMGNYSYELCRKWHDRNNIVNIIYDKLT